MDKEQKVPRQLLSNVNEFPISSTDATYLQYERKVAGEVTISPSVAERTRERLTDTNIKRAISVCDGKVLIRLQSFLFYSILFIHSWMK